MEGFHNRTPEERLSQMGLDNIPPVPLYDYATSSHRTNSLAGLGPRTTFSAFGLFRATTRTLPALLAMGLHRFPSRFYRAYTSQCQRRATGLTTTIDNEPCSPIDLPILSCYLFGSQLQPQPSWLIKPLPPQRPRAIHR